MEEFRFHNSVVLALLNNVCSQLDHKRLIHHFCHLKAAQSSNNHLFSSEMRHKILRLIWMTAGRQAMRANKKMKGVSNQSNQIEDNYGEIQLPRHATCDKPSACNGTIKHNDESSPSLKRFEIGLFLPVYLLVLKLKVFTSFSTHMTLTLCCWVTIGSLKEHRFI